MQPFWYRCVVFSSCSINNQKKFLSELIFTVLNCWIQVFKDPPVPIFPPSNTWFSFEPERVRLSSSFFFSQTCMSEHISKVLKATGILAPPRVSRVRRVRHAGTCPTAHTDPRYFFNSMEPFASTSAPHIRSTVLASDRATPFMDPLLLVPAPPPLDGASLIVARKQVFAPFPTPRPRTHTFARSPPSPPP
jgi:hypothetical protein